MPLDQAATLVGIPIEEASEYARKRLESGELDAVSLHLSAHDAMMTGLDVLKRIARESPRERIEEIGRKHEGKKVVVSHTDLEAAQTLVKFALEAKKILRTSVGKPEQRSGRGMSVQLDLWDNLGNWELADQTK